MTSLIDLDQPSPIRDFMSQVIRTIQHKKEFLAPGGGPSGPTGPGGGPDPNGPAGPDPSPSPSPDPTTTTPPPPPPTTTPPPPTTTPAITPETQPLPGTTPATTTPATTTPATTTPAETTAPGETPDIDIGPPQSKTDGTPAERAQLALDKAAQAKDPKNIKRWLAAGFALAAIAAILATTLTHFMASDGAEIRLVTIKGEGDAPRLIPSIFVGKPTQVACVWEVRKVGHPGGIKSAVRITDKDELEWHDSTLSELDGKNNVKPTKIKGDHEFRVESGLSNSKDIDIKDQGWVKIHTSFEDQLDQTVADAAAAGADFFTNLLKAITGLGIGTFVFIAICVIVVIFILPLLSDLTKSNSSNK